MQEIQGNVESVVFQNDENGYTVAKFKEGKQIITIVGCMPYMTEGQNLKLMGQWIVHPQFGQQFKVQSVEEIIPTTLAGMEKYLSSGVIQGIGPVTAKKIVEKFGESTIEILDSNIERLGEIDGIGEKKLSVIVESYKSQSEVRNIMIFFQSYGVSVNQCIKIYKRFGSEAVDAVRNNPYVLTEEISGIGFKTADKIARNIGMEADSPFRIQSGIIYVLNQFCALGNTYMPMNKLLKDGSEVLSVSPKIIEENVINSALEGKIKVDMVGEERCVFGMPYYYCELGVTKKVISLCMNKYDALDIDIDEEIGAFEESNGISFASSQREAIKGAVENGVEIITGGPGTGKTTIINCIGEVFEKAGLRIMLAAPTGRAAKRMTEATGREAKTIHRLLEMGVSEESSEVFMKGEDTPLECDVVIVDEASMIDIMLMNNLLKALAPGTRLIIVGDVDQLPSVGPGNVLRDLIDSKCVKVVRLTAIFRQSEKSMITVNAHKINNGEMPVLNERNKDFFFINGGDPHEIMNTLVELIDKRLPKFNDKWNKKSDIQILSPMRKGMLGADNLNRKLQDVLNPPNADKKEKEVGDMVLRVGDKVMQTKNNYQLKWKRVSGFGEDEGAGVFNGDIGYIESMDEEKNTVSILFDEDKRIVYDNIYLDELDLAYAMTVHKSQGSEFPVVIMPAFMGAPMLMNRNLFYTGITRAKQLVVLVGDIKAVKYMIDNNRSFERYSLLKWRISEIIESGVV